MNARDGIMTKGQAMHVMGENKMNGTPAHRSAIHRPGLALVRKLAAWLAACLLLGAFCAPGVVQAASVGTVVAGPYTVTLPNTKLFSYSTSFSASSNSYIVRVQLSAANSLTALSVNLNSTQVIGLADFAGGVTQVDRVVTLVASNTIALQLAGATGTKITVTVYNIVMPKPTALAPNPLALNVGAVGQLSATLTPAPTLSGTLSVTSSNSAIATAPTSIAFAAGQGTVVVPVTAVAPGSATITVTANGGQASATINVNAPPTVSITAPAANSIVTAPATFSITANAADADGTVARVDFYANNILIGTATAAPYTFTWANVPAGSYSLTARATDNLGASTTSAAVAVIANAAPTVSLTAPANNTVAIAPGSFTLTANAADSDGSIAKVEFFNNGATLIGTATAAPYSTTWTNVAAGSYTITARATDNHGASATSTPINVISDALPAVALTSPAANTVAIAPGSFTLTATASSTTSTIAKVDFYAGTTLLGTATAAPYSFTWTNVPAGSYSLTAKATDALATTATSAAVAIISNAPPTVSLTNPAANAVSAAPGSFTLSANATDSDGTIARVDFYANNGTTNTLVGTATAVPYSFTWINVAAGSYTLTAIATDNLGAQATSAAVSVISDALPTVSLTSPTANAVSVAPGSFTLTATASNTTSSIARVDFYANSLGTHTLIGTATTATGGVYNFTWANVPAGSYSLTAVATDSLGTTATSAAVTVTSDQAPSVTLTSPTAGAQITSPNSYTLTATAASVTSTIARVDFYNGTTLLGTATVAPYSFTWANVPVGVYSLTAVATDALGTTTASAAVSVTAIANVPPAVSLTSPAANATATAPGSFTLSANATSVTSSIAKVDFYASNGTTNTLVGTATTATAGTYSFIWSNVALGSYNITAIATDTVNATTTSSPVTVTVNTGIAQAYYIHPDHLDTPRQITDSSGNVVWQWDNVDPFGNNMANENPAGAGTFNFNLRFPGQYFDRETNTHQNINRDYDPSIGRYIESDPIGLWAGINTYTYVGGNPISRKDPKGLDWDELIPPIPPYCNPEDPVSCSGPPPQQSPRTQCNIKCNFKYQMVCTAASVGVAATTRNAVAAGIVGGSCILVKALVCDQASCCNAQ